MTIDINDEQKIVTRQLFDRELKRLKKLRTAQVKRGAKADYVTLTSTKMRILEEVRDAMKAGGLFG